MTVDKQKSFINEILFAILLPLLSVACSYGISFFNKIIGQGKTIVLLLIFIIAIAATTYLGYVFHSIIVVGLLEKKLDLDIKAIQTRIANDKIINGIYLESQLALMEKTYSFSEIWLVSPDLHTEIDAGVYAGVVYDNLKKGVKYEYFVPDNDINRVRVDEFINKCNHNKNLHVHFLTDDFFFLVPSVDISIYEPRKCCADGKKGFIGLPIVGAKDNFAVLMNNNFVDVVTRKLSQLISEE